ncbi:MAG: metalloregulator ArsR/SmtB family transcription factor [Candidatus Dormibacteraeota bacterium]|nr:metalloregulator ArsR/SmtB family transcription factor [Candidatus Dormibacteraeota bacterium]
MPPVDMGEESAPAIPEVRPSAPLELLWLGHLVLTHPDGGDPRLAALGPEATRRLAGELQDFWKDGHAAGMAEMVVLADLSGELFSERLDRLLPNLPEVDDLSAAELRSETDEDRGRILERLARLARDAATRRRYGLLLQAIWQPLVPEWESRGLPQVRASGSSLARRLQRGEPIATAAEVVERLRRKNQAWGELIVDGERRGRLALVPAYFGGSWSIWDLPRHVVVGFSEGASPTEELRDEARHLSSRLRVLGDATRMALLLRLAERPTSVGELARMFDLAQPTVSAHLRALRDATLVTTRRDGPRTLYRADRESLSELLAQVAARTGASR